MWNIEVRGGGGGGGYVILRFTLTFLWLLYPLPAGHHGYIDFLGRCGAVVLIGGCLGGFRGMLILKVWIAVS